MSNSHTKWNARYPEFQGEVRQIGDCMHALAHILYRGNRFKGLYMYKYSASDNVW